VGNGGDEVNTPVRLGIGTWNMGEKSSSKAQEVRALQEAIGLGMTLIDTAEMYGEGGAEEVVGEAIEGHDDVFVVSKVYPHNAGRKSAIAACERSLRRLRRDKLEVYLLHWRGSIPLSETFEAFEQLKAQGKIDAYGVSNFDTDDMEEARGFEVVTNQILYNLTRRGPEYDLIPWCRNAGISIMAYSPVEQGRLLRERKLADLAAKKGCTPAQLALAWVLAQPGVYAIPKSSSPEHVKENRAALDIVLSAEDLKALDAAFPPPRSKKSLEML
jgi:diketogulonate reductase-like aldo/keto reductase